MDLRSRRVLLAACLIVGTVAIDQGVKQVARAVLPPGRALRAFPGVLLCLTQNRGAFLSIGSSLPAAVRFWVLTVGVLAALFGILVWLLASRAFPPWPAAGMSLIVGGGVSNLLDRVRLAGEVTDFLVLSAGRLHTGVFNLADVAITGGTLLVASAFWARPPAGAGSARQ